jgi:hypothetical protein
VLRKTGCWDVAAFGEELPPVMEELNSSARLVT